MGPGQAVIFYGFNQRSRLESKETPNNIKTFFMVIIIEFDQVGIFCTAGSTPGSPEIDQQIISADEISNGNVHPCRILHGERHIHLPDRCAL